MSDARIGKLEIAGLHARAAIQMIVIGCNPFSVHLPVMACNEIVKAVASHVKIDLTLDFSRLVRPERLREWNVASARAYNFFKHADRDPLATLPRSDLDRIERLNDIEMIANIIHLHDLGHDLPKVYQAFLHVIPLLYPGLIDWEAIVNDNPALGEFYERVKDPSRELALTALQSALMKAGELPLPDFQETAVFATGGGSGL